MAASFGFEMLLVAEIDQRVETIYGLDDHVAAAATIPAIGPTIFDMGLTTEADASGTTVTTSDIDFCGIEKLHCPAIR
jgi:hypothetical protein